LDSFSQNQDWANYYLVTLGQKLQSRGFTLYHRIKFSELPYNLDLFALQTKYELSKLGKISRCFAFVHFPKADQSTIIEFSKNAADYGTFGIQGEFSTINSQSCFVYSIALLDHVDDEIISWMSKYRPEKRWKGVEFPILIYEQGRSICMNRSTPFWGAAYYSGLIKYIEDLIV